MGYKENKNLIDSFVYANFNYSPLVWHFCPAKSLRKIEKIQKRAFTKRTNLNPKFLKDIFQKTKWLTYKPSNIKIHCHNTIRYGDKSLTTLGPRIWSSLTKEVKVGPHLP